MIEMFEWKATSRLWQANFFGAAWVRVFRWQKSMPFPCQNLEKRRLLTWNDCMIMYDPLRIKHIKHQSEPFMSSWSILVSRFPPIAYFLQRAGRYRLPQQRFTIWPAAQVHLCPGVFCHMDDWCPFYIATTSRCLNSGMDAEAHTCDWSQFSWTKLELSSVDLDLPNVSFSKRGDKHDKRLAKSTPENWGQIFILCIEKDSP